MESGHFDTDFFRLADLCILDAQYTLSDAFLKLYWGHTSINMAVNTALNWKVKNLVLTHHEPAYDDEKIWHNFKEAKEHLKLLGENNLNIYIAREGMVFRL